MLSFDKSATIAYCDGAANAERQFSPDARLPTRSRARFGQRPSPAEIWRDGGQCLLSSASRSSRSNGDRKTFDDL